MRFAVPVLLVTLLAAPGCKKLEPRAEVEARKEKQAAKARRLQEACASQASYERLKAVAFDKARDLRGDDAALLDRLAANTVVRMEEPVVKSRDEVLNVTVCSGTMVIDLPPGVKAAFSGARRLEAKVEYAAQAAADGSGLVYSLDGAEPIIARLAAFGVKSGGDPQLASADPAPSEVAPAETPPAAPAAPVVPPAPSEARTPAPAPATSPPPTPPPRARPASTAQPSFNCRYARSRSERMVCSDAELARRDRAMSSMFYQALAAGDGTVRRELRRSRDDFLAVRDRCATPGCVAAAYDRRMDEIEAIAAGEY
jgi:hypothetical protein